MPTLDRSRPFKTEVHFLTQTRMIVQDGHRYTEQGVHILDFRPTEHRFTLPCYKCEFLAQDWDKLVSHMISLHQATADIIERERKRSKNLLTGAPKDQGVTPVAGEAAADKKPKEFQCQKCGRDEYPNRQAFAAHTRFCKAQKSTEQLTADAEGAAAVKAAKEGK